MLQDQLAAGMMTVTDDGAPVNAESQVEHQAFVAI